MYTILLEAVLSVTGTFVHSAEVACECAALYTTSHSHRRGVKGVVNIKPIMLSTRT